MTSSILPPRRALAPCSPSTQLMASTTLDLPEPLGPTTAVMPGSKRRVVDDAKDLKPFSVRLLRYTTRQTTARIVRSTLTAGCRRTRNLPILHSPAHWPHRPHQSLSEGRFVDFHRRVTARRSP